MRTSSGYKTKISAILESLGISEHLISNRRLVLQIEAHDLVTVEIDDEGREQKLAPQAAQAWAAMRSSAQGHGVVLKVASGFRSVERQVEIIRGKMAEGLTLDSILTAVAPPGYSEHHTGLALDITTDGVPPVDIEFEHTNAFRWLNVNAEQHGFSLSYPKENKFRYQYEPWHWRFKG